MKHIMKINDNAYDRMQKGTKIREYRVHDEKRQQVKIGDMIEFQKISNPKETILMEVTDIELYPTLNEAVSSHFKEDFSNRHIDILSTVNSFYEKGYYTKEEVSKYGIVVFKINKTMKVLSIKEPFATLIKENKKFIETRSWKTKYRGELYIHASVSKIKKSYTENKELMSILDNSPLSYGYIICKCNLVDCIYMTKEYVENIRNNNYQEYICGYYEEGRYAWILEDIEPLDTKIEAKGKLNIWTYK